MLLLWLRHECSSVRWWFDRRSALLADENREYEAKVTEKDELQNYIHGVAPFRRRVSY